MIQMKTFYLIAAILMFFAVIGNIWNLLIVWNTLTIGGKISSIFGSVLFNLLLFVLFAGFYKITPSSNAPAKILDSKELESLLNEVQKQNRN